MIYLKTLYIELTEEKTKNASKEQFVSNFRKTIQLEKMSEIKQEKYKSKTSVYIYGKRKPERASYFFATIPNLKPL